MEVSFDVDISKAVTKVAVHTEFAIGEFSTGFDLEVFYLLSSFASYSSILKTSQSKVSLLNFGTDLRPGY